MINLDILLLLLLSSPIITSQKVLEKRSGTAWNYWTNKAFGPNLGNWLVLERWMGDEPFRQARSSASDEWTLSASTPNAAAILKRHWDTWVTQDDFRMLASVRANHVRIPVGYWAFIKPDPGEPYVSHGQQAQMERILGYCATYGIYAIIDLHGLPGSQNGEMHSGHSGPRQFFTPYNINRGIRTVSAVVDWINGLDHRLKQQIAAVEAANEPRPEGDHQYALLRDYYQRAYAVIAASPFKIPMVFHDTFRASRYWSDFLPPPANAVIDLHPYWAFPPAHDTNAILAQVCAKRKSPFHLPVLYGEWSLASGVSSSEWWLRQFMDTQVSVYQQGNAAGAVFWALKNRINANVWSFEQLVQQGIINNGTFSLHTNAKC
ncbi:glycoside hydrolase superfamily [Chlamydoabsidia padenii]|nr:glycoside hydrolase superfamily [Chlamydoabsidia padenii]